MDTQRGRAALLGLPIVAFSAIALANLAIPGVASVNDPGPVVVLFAAIIAVFGGVGTILVARQPGNTVGWILWIVGVLIGLNLAAAAYGGLSVAAYAGALPGTVLVDWYTSWSFSPPLVIGLLLLPLLFPDGRLPSPRWRVVLIGCLAIILLAALNDMLTPGLLAGAKVPNPTGWTGDPAVLDLLAQINQLTPIVALPIVIASAVVRYRRGSATERQQLKWFGATAAVAVLSLAIATLTSEPVSSIFWLIAVLGMGLIPVAIGIAILRYRLYEIDRIISRTIGWLVMSAILGAVFVAVIVGLQAILAGLTANNTLAVAASTLVVAALFAPVRTRVQRAVDRRFQRARYDADRTAAAFAAHLQQVVDMETLRAELRTVIGMTLEPSSFRVWVRSADRKGSR